MLSPLVSPAELRGSVVVVVVDTRSGSQGAAAYATSHLAGALHADLERDLSGDFSDPSVGGRHPLPSLDAWAATLGRLGIGTESDVVVYDDQCGANAAARMWWMLRAVGHPRVRVLDGGLAAAEAAGLAMEATPPVVAPRPPYPVPSAWLLPTVDSWHVAAHAGDPNHKLLDVRAAPRYRGEVEPLDPVAGHIPGADNIHYTLNLRPDGRFLDPRALALLYRRYLDGAPEGNLVVSCGSGVTACHTLLALESAGIEGAKLYVGSWSEWCRSTRKRAR
jgi:thiosulfate/3-mercaptopyruvate sulfurtransferase